jgi:hypothetical protein
MSVITAETLKQLYRSKLSGYEQTEILDYPEIYFLGLEFVIDFFT